MSEESYSKAKRVTWTPAIHEIFVDLCLEQTLRGNKPGTHFNKEGWRNILESFNKNSGFKYERRQIRNHWDFSKEQWRVWSKLVKDSRMKWDPETNKFRASDEDWENYTKENPGAAQFKFKELQDTEKLEIIFDGTIDTEDTEQTTQGKRKNILEDAVNVHSKRSTKFPSHQNNSGSSVRKSKAIWTPSMHETFIDLCVEETLKGNKPGTHFTKEGWRNIVELFHQKVGLSFDRMQLKNHWDITKEQWKIWCKLIGTSSMKWDPDTKKFGATVQDWVNYLQANPEAAQFQFKEIQHAEKLETLFDRTTKTGETDPPMLSNEPIRAEPDMKNGHCYDAVESRSAVTVQRSPVMVQSMHGRPNFGIGECIECLDGMEEVEQGSDLYLFALDIFLKKEYREIFLQLKKPSVRIAWLQRLQTVGPPLQ